MIEYLPIRLQVRWWAWRRKNKIEAIRELRRSSGLSLKDSKDLLDPFFPPFGREVCPTCGRRK